MNTTNSACGSSHRGGQTSQFDGRPGHSANRLLAADAHPSGRVIYWMACYYRKRVRSYPDESRSSPRPDRILVAQLTGTARHHARWRELAQDEQDAAVTELRELAGGRADLLAEVAGIFEGASEGELDEPLARQAAHLCRLAGADETLIPQWIAEGRHRAEAARMLPRGSRSAENKTPAELWPRSDGYMS
jgi:hypothetical protein